jgi:acylglycerol lipase
MFRRWAAPEPAAALILVHGMGGHSDRYQECGRTWAGRGISTYALELRGFGHTEGPKGHVDTFDVYHKDLEILLARVMAEHSRRPVFLLGESMGGVLSVDFILRRPALLSGLILVAPSFRDRLSVPLATKAQAFLHVLARHRKWYDVPWNPADFTRDPALIDFLNADPYEVKKVTAQFYFAYTPVSARARKAAPFLKLPVLVCLPGEDRMIDSTYTREFFERIDSPDKKLVEYEGHFHALLLDVGRERVLGEIADWIRERS